MAAASGYTDLREKLKSMTSRDNSKAGSREAAAAEPYLVSGTKHKYQEDSDQSAATTRSSSCRRTRRRAG
jgi:alkylated DNA repair protein alkB family protein 5